MVSLCSSIRSFSLAFAPFSSVHETRKFFVCFLHACLKYIPAAISEAKHVFVLFVFIHFVFLTDDKYKSMTKHCMETYNLLQFKPFNVHCECWSCVNKVFVTCRAANATGGGTAKYNKAVTVLKETITQTKIYQKFTSNLKYVSN